MKVVPLHQNESYWLLTGELLSLYTQTDTRTFSTYPTYEDLIASLAGYAGVDANSLIATAGSDAAIRLLADICVRDRSRVVLPVPTFYGYERIFAQAGLTALPVPYREERGAFRLPLDETLAAMQNADAIFFCQPNNPLGSLISDSDMNAILDQAKKQYMLAVMDEAYFEFTGKTSLSRLASQKLVVLRTLSKAFGLSGARVGYCIAEPKLIVRMRSLMLPWPIAHESVKAALAALSHVERFKERVAALIEERARFAAELSAIPGVVVYPSETNFLLTRVPDSSAVAEHLKNQGILVAEGHWMTMFSTAKPMLENTVRMAVPSPEDRSLVVRAFAEAVRNSRQ